MFFWAIGSLNVAALVEKCVFSLFLVVILRAEAFRSQPEQKTSSVPLVISKSIYPIDREEWIKNT